MDVIKLKLVSKTGPSQAGTPTMVFDVVSTTPGAEGKLQNLVQQIGEELFPGVKKDGQGKVTVDYASTNQGVFSDAEDSSSSLEEVKEDPVLEEAKVDQFVVPVVKMPVFDRYGLPVDGFDYYKFIKTEVSGGDFIAAESSLEQELAKDSDFGKKLSSQERAVLEALENAEEYESLDEDFLEQAAESPDEEDIPDPEEADQEFEKVAKEYDSDIPEPSNSLPLIKGAQLDALMEEFKQEHPDLIPPDPVSEPEQIPSFPEPIPYEEDHCLRKWEEIEEENGDAIAEKAYETLAYREPEERDDVESIVSTYTNTDNRPVVITVHSRPRKLKEKKESETSTEAKTDQKSTFPNIPIPDNETKEEKKIRKAAIKEAKKTQRAAKKDLKTSFKTEKAKQVRQISGKYDTPQGYSVVKIS